MNRIALAFAASVLALTVSACSTKDDDESVARSKLTTSCVIEKEGLRSCLEYTNLPPEGRDLAAKVCSDEGGSFTPDQACSRTDALAGCIQGGDEALANTADPRLVVWYYKGGVVQEVAQAERACVEDKFVVR